MLFLKMSVNKILSLSMRPDRFADLVGQEEITSVLKKQFESKRVPHFFILTGPVGSGKTTMARIISHCLQNFRTDTPFENITSLFSSGDIEEINAATDNGVDHVRNLISRMRYIPLHSMVKIVILDEAHQLTPQSQNALLHMTEDSPEHAYFIFCTSTPQKILPALRRRAFVISPVPLKPESIQKLIVRASEFVSFTGDIQPLLDELDRHNITSPGLITQAAERFFSGMSPSVPTVDNTSLDAASFARKLIQGDWIACSSFLKKMKKTDVYPTRMIVLNYLKQCLLNESVSKRWGLSKIIDRLIDVPLDENISLAAFASAISSIISSNVV
jgi:hypothetical protein